MSCCSSAGPPEASRFGTWAQRAGFCLDEPFIPEKWDRLVLTTDCMREFYRNHPLPAKIVSLPLSAIRFVLRTALAPIINAISMLVLPIMGAFAKQPGRYYAAAGWALLSTIKYAAIICILVFALSQQKMIIALSIYGGLGILGEMYHGWNVRPHSKHDERTHFPLEATINDTRTSCLGVISEYLCG